MSEINLTAKDALNILNTVTDFHLGAEKVERFVGCPYVDGDNVALHTARTVRLAIYAMPFILKEFAEHPDIKHLAEDIYATVLIHDDEEIVQGFDIISPLKNHNVDVQKEIYSVNNKIKNLPILAREYVIKLFSSFRKRDTLASRISKVLENITSNQLVIEQKLGIITPDATKFAIDFVDKFKGISKTSDLLVYAQINQIIDYRKFAKNNDTELEFLVEKALKQKGCNLSKKELQNLINKLLDIDILQHQIDKSKININLWEYN